MKSLALVLLLAALSSAPLQAVLVDSVQTTVTVTAEVQHLALPVVDPVGLPSASDQVPAVEEEKDKIEEETVPLPALEETHRRLGSAGGVKRKSRWRPINFMLGAAGGTLLGGYVGFYEASGPSGLDQSALGKNFIIYGSAGAVVGGFLGMALGALATPDPVPPGASQLVPPSMVLALRPGHSWVGLSLHF